MINVLRGFLGMAILLAICYLLSKNRKAIDWKMVGIGIGLQIVLAFGITQVEGIRSVFEWVVRFFSVMLQSSQKSSQF